MTPCLVNIGSASPHYIDLTRRWIDDAAAGVDQSVGDLAVTDA